MLSSGADCGCDPDLREAQGARSSVVRGLLRGDIADTRRIGDLTLSASAQAEALAPAYLASLQHFAEEGGQAPQALIDKVQATYDQIQSTYQDVKNDVSKLEAVGEDAAMGASIGIVLGPYGAAAGAVIGAIYGVFDNFGGDIMAVLNPPDFSEDDYTRQKQKAIASGAIPNWGVPPDQYMGCVYPDGTYSGGDEPYPGTWNGEIRDRAAFDKHRALDARLSWKPGFVIGPTGAPEPAPEPASLKTRLRTATRIAIEKRNQITPLTGRQANAIIARYKQLQTFTSVNDKLIHDAGARDRLLRNVRAVENPTSPASAAVKTAKTDAAAPPPSSSVSTPVVVGGVAAVGAAAGGLYWLLRRRR